MKLYLEHETHVIADIRRRGLAAVLGDDEVMLCDRSLANELPPDVPEGTPVPEGFDEAVFEVPDEHVAEREVAVTDVPPGRYFLFAVGDLAAVASLV